MNFRVTCLLILSLLLLLPTAVLAQQGVTAFNYQGQIFDAGGQPVTGQCDFSFQIYDTVDSPTALATLQIDDLSVADGLFSVSIDFGPDVFDTSPRWLETAVRCESDPDFDSLGRQQILSVPYATYAYGVDWANVKNRPEYTVGPGLTLTGTEFSIPAAFQLPHDCADNEIPKWSGSSWACAVDSNSDTLVTLSCEVGQVAEWRANGWACSTPSGEGTTYTAGVGLSLTGTQFSIPIPYQLPQGCAAGERASWTGSRWACTRTVDAYTKAEVDTALTGKIDATEVYTTAEINSWLAAVQADLAGKIDGTDVYTTSQVDSLLERRADISHTHTAVATATVALAVDWGDIINVPAGLADGTDDSDDLVSWSEISGIVGTGATDVARGNHTHTYADPTNGTGVYLEYKPNNIACMSNQVLKWDAAGSRWVCGNASGGDITGVTAGSGLTGGGASGSVTLGADFAGTGNASTVARSDHNHDADYYTQGQVDTALATKVDATEVYTAAEIDSQMATVQADLATKIDASEVYTTGQLDAALAQKLDASDHTWSGLLGVPAGFSDDTDDTDDTVSWTEISGIVGTGATEVAGGSHNHGTDYYTQGQVDTALAGKIDATEAYTTGQVDAALAQKLDASAHTWSGLSGVPAGFSDDTDDTDDTVSWSEISGIVGTGTTEVAGGSHNHDTHYYTQGQVDTALADKIDATEVYTTGQVDAALAQKLDASDHTWSGLSGVPSGFSDDTDDTDDTVSWSEINEIVGTGPTEVAGGSHDHDTAYVNEGQTDSITSAMVTDGSITSSDLQDGAALAEILDDDGSGSGLDADRLDGQSSSAFASSSHNHDTDYYTQGQVDTGLALKIDATEVYTTGAIDSQMATVQADLVTKIDASEVYTSGQVDTALAQKLDASDHTWSGLSGVPAGFLDDTDDTNDTVSWSEISGIVGTGATEVAGGSHNHDAAYVNEGQANSITSTMITNGSVTSADLQDGAALAEILDDDGSGSGLDADKLDGQSSAAFATSSHAHDSDYYTQGQVDTALGNKIDATEVYTTGQVDAALAQKLDATDHTWSGLSGVPSGFSDDTDDTDDTVSWSEISGIVGTGATDVAGGSHNHDAAYVDEGQTDSITSAMITDGSVTSSDLQDGAALAEILDDDGSGSGLDADKLDGQSSAAFATSSHAHDSDYYTQGQVDTALGNKIDATEVYTTGQVDAALAQKLDATDHTWSGLSGVPTGFSDDTDDTNDTVSWSEISGIVGTGATEVAGGSHNHDAAYVDEGQTDSITSAMITDGSVTSADLQDGAALAEILDDDGSGSSLDADKLDGQDSSYYWGAGGNAATAGDFIGTTNTEPLVFKTNNLVGLRIDQGTGAATDAPAVVGGYSGNTYGKGATIAGGGRSNAINRATGGYSFVGGGLGNAALEAETTIGGGYGNTVGSGWSTIGGGESNTVNADWSFIGGGFSNQVTGGGTSVVAGGATNSASGAFSFVGGGESNTVSGDYSVVAGGYQNVLTSTANYASVGGGRDNQASGSYAVIGGGNGNTASSGSSTVGGGTGNVASSSSATVSGGQSNTASGGSSAIGGGQSNTASANWGTVSGGYNNTVSSSYSTIGGGFGNQISSTGLGAAIPGGLNNAAPGATSFAAGRQAKANHDGTFVWGDSTSADIASNAGNSVTFRASGGYRLFTNSAASTGASLAAGGGSWASMSDRNQKENLQPVDTQAVLEQVGQLPLSTWNYISQEHDIRHIGPMAQDFHAAFGVGENETTITAVDGDGVSLAAIQALYERVKALEAENEALKAENEAEKARLDVLEARLDVLEAAVQ